MPDTAMPEMEAHTQRPETTQEELTKRERTREQIRKLQQELRQREAKDITGAASLAPKTQMLGDARELEQIDPDHKYRYINITDPAKAKVRRHRGYVPVSEQEAEAAGVDARHGNELVLMKIPREQYEARVAAQKKVNKDRLNAHKAEVTKVAEAIVRELRDKHGLDIPVGRLLVSEE